MRKNRSLFCLAALMVLVAIGAGGTEKGSSKIDLFLDAWHEAAFKKQAGQEQPMLPTPR